MTFNELVEKLIQRNSHPVTSPEGCIFWYHNGILHREDGPAITYINGGQAWYINGKMHRENGPAYDFGPGYQRYYLNDIEYFYREYWQEMYKRGKITKRELFIKLL